MDDLLRTSGYHSNVNIAAVAELLQDPDLDVQNKAVEMMIQINHPDTVKYLADALKDLRDVEPEVGRLVFGNIPEVIVVVFYVTVAVFLALTFYLFAQRARNWERGTWEEGSRGWVRSR